MLVSNSQFEHELKKVLTQEIERLSENILSVGNVTDYAKYCSIAGEIIALKRVINSYCGEVNTNISKR